MKRSFLMVVLFATVCNPVFAVDDDKKPVILDINGKADNAEYGEIPRSPIRHPSLFIEEHTLSFSNSCLGFILELVQDDAIVYTYLINSTDDLVLPSELVGIYEIRLIGGSFTFVGEIEL